MSSLEAIIQRGSNGKEPFWKMIECGDSLVQVNSRSRVNPVALRNFRWGNTLLCLACLLSLMSTWPWLGKKKLSNFSPALCTSGFLSGGLTRCFQCINCFGVEKKKASTKCLQVTAYSMSAGRFNPGDCWVLKSTVTQKMGWMQSTAIQECIWLLRRETGPWTWSCQLAKAVSRAVSVGQLVFSL